MNRQGVGILGCGLVIAGAAVAIAVVFFESAILAAGIPYHFLNCSLLAVALFGVAATCGLMSWRTPAGKVALGGSVVLGALFVGFVILVCVAFLIQH